MNLNGAAARLLAIAVAIILLLVGGAAGSVYQSEQHSKILAEVDTNEDRSLLNAQSIQDMKEDLKEIKAALIAMNRKLDALLMSR